MPTVCITSRGERVDRDARRRLAQVPLLVPRAQALSSKPVYTSLHTASRDKSQEHLPDRATLAELGDTTVRARHVVASPAHRRRAARASPTQEPPSGTSSLPRETKEQPHKVQEGGSHRPTSNTIVQIGQLWETTPPRATPHAQDGVEPPMGPHSQIRAAAGRNRARRGTNPAPHLGPTRPWSAQMSSGPGSNLGRCQPIVG